MLANFTSLSHKVGIILGKEPIHVTKTKSLVLVLFCRLQCDAVEIHDSETFRALPVASREPLGVSEPQCHDL